MVSLMESWSVLRFLPKPPWLKAIFQPLLMIMIVWVLALVGTTAVANDLPEPTSEKFPQQPSETIQGIPLSLKARHRPQQRRVTGAAMTNHQLTAAHMFSHRSTGQLSPKIGQESEHS